MVMRSPCGAGAALTKLFAWGDSARASPGLQLLPKKTFKPEFKFKPRFQKSRSLSRLDFALA